MPKLKKPSTPVVNGTNVSVDAVPGATKYKLYKIVYRLGTKFLLADGKMFLTKDNKLFQTARNV